MNDFECYTPEAINRQNVAMIAANTDAILYHLEKIDKCTKKINRGLTILVLFTLISALAGRKDEIKRKLKNVEGALKM